MRGYCITPLALSARARWRQGSFGEIYLAHPERDESITVAAKIGKGEGRDMLMREAKVLHSLRGYHGVPEMYGCGQEGEYYVMLMELLGPSLSDVMVEVRPRRPTCSACCGVRGRAPTPRLTLLCRRSLSL